ncbi:two-component system, OmpR family, sensor kinase [Nocardioides exalbidus]|uniref:histidine kinase n=1 Tax=Nocardioides exalbidus TaxID=402596 RepID=A0A1H4KK43_9ACTN|nr:HAMP domain-containing sensor histidine kinase [Nocardioides exalbidus]SEB58458.1 two-component system, OmpR family, sensor kinase [Nocardioides exalbidus]
MNRLRSLTGRPLTLTARLVAVAVLLVAVTALAIGTATTLAMRQSLDKRLDADVADTMRTLFGPGRGGPGDFGAGQEYGTLYAGFLDDGPVKAGGQVLNHDEDDRGPRRTSLTDDQLDALSGLDPSEEPQDVTIPGLGDYRVLVTDLSDGVAVVGLPCSDVDATISDLVRLELLATALGVLAAAGVGLWVVRRQLAPLREVSATAHRVSELPLGSGEIELGERVPERLTDDRTEVGQVGAALNSMLDHVESSLAERHRSEQQVRQFVADASHELRTPLATIAGYTELARKRPEATGTALDKVETESARMTGLVEDLLLLARLDSGRPLVREPVDLSRLLIEAVDDARVVDPERSWRLALPDAPITVQGDGARLHQVVSNLLTNGRKYTPAGSTITVTGTAYGFTVRDDGPGFPTDLAPRAFERFVRGDASRNRAGGAGLGLSLVEAIVLAHGGTVSLRSEPGETVIAVDLPGDSPIS